MKKLMGKVLIACLALVMCGSLAACGGSDDGLDAEGNVSRVTMWVGGSEWSGQNLRNLEAFINAYNAAKPDGFTVKLERKDDLEKSFQTSRTQGRQPDLMLWDRFNTATNVVSNYLYPVSDLIERDGINTGAFYGPAMQEMQYGGETYGLPVDVDVWGTYVNMDMVQQYDTAHPDSAIGNLLTADWTWNDLLTAAKALKSGNVAGYSSGDQEQHLFKFYVSTGHGSEYLTLADANKGRYETNFNNQWTRDVLNFFKEVKNANVGGKQEDTSFT
ncbi:MAG: extracellular solute-binding protein, partial [Clostridiales bacterium]|nr:extracellular solute-binding protein [Clostridiales bacterium]